MRWQGCASSQDSRPRFAGAGECAFACSSHALKLRPPRFHKGQGTRLATSPCPLGRGRGGEQRPLEQRLRSAGPKRVSRRLRTEMQRRPQAQVCAWLGPAGRRPSDKGAKESYRLPGLGGEEEEGAGLGGRAAGEKASLVFKLPVPGQFPSRMKGCGERGVGRGLRGGQARTLQAEGPTPSPAGTQAQESGEDRGGDQSLNREKEEGKGHIQ